MNKRTCYAHPGNVNRQRLPNENETLRLVYIDAIKYWTERLTENPDNAIAMTAIFRLTSEAARLGREIK